MQSGAYANGVGVGTEVVVLTAPVVVVFGRFVVVAGVVVVLLRHGLYFVLSLSGHEIQSHGVVEL